MPAEIIIIIGPKPAGGGRSAEQAEGRTIKVKLEGEGSVPDMLREAADVLDGTEE